MNIFCDIIKKKENNRQKKRIVIIEFFLLVSFLRVEFKKLKRDPINVATMPLFRSHHFVARNMGVCRRGKRGHRPPWDRLKISVTAITSCPFSLNYV